MRFVETKTPEQQSCLMLHRSRQLFIRQQDLGHAWRRFQCRCRCQLIRGPSLKAVLAHMLSNQLLQPFNILDLLLFKIGPECFDVRGVLGVRYVLIITPNTI
jgi:hypothetical protein